MSLLRPNGLARSAVRFKPASFVGTFVALLLAAAIASGCGLLLQTGITASLAPDRYAGAPVVAAADQEVHTTVKRGEDTETESAALPGRARLDAALVARAATAQGAARAVGDVSYPVGTPWGGSLTAAGWGSSAFTAVRTSTGTAPATGQAVVGDPRARVGERITLATPAGPRTLTVSGTTTTPGVWLTDAEALALSGHPRQVDAIAVLPAPGTTPAALAAEVTRVLHAGQADGAAKDRILVHTGDDRARAEGAALPAAKELLIALGGSFGGTATLVAVFTAAGTVALSVGQRSREFALLRAIGATPRQIRRSIATEALLLAPLAGALGCLPGLALAHWWFGQLRDRGAVPQGITLDTGPLPFAIAVAVVAVTALAAGLAAARRPARIPPGSALAEAQVERRAVGPVRAVLGVVAVAGGIVLAGIAAGESGEDAANAALGVVMLFMLAVALLGPLIARLCATLAAGPLRAAAAPGHLAAANSRTNARRLASALTPIVLALSFASTLVFLHTSVDRATEHQQRAGVTADHVVTAPAGAGLPTGALARAAATPGVTAAVAVQHTGVLLPDDLTGYRSATAQGVSADPRPVLDLDVRTGSLAALRPGTVAVDANLADAADVRTGDRLPLLLPDGTLVRPQVIATYGRGLGLGEVTLPAADLAGHAATPYADELLVRGGRAADLTALGAVTDAAGRAAGQSSERALNAWANTTMAAVLGGFAAVAAANTLVMTVLDRRRELRTLRLIGTTRRQVLRMIRWEALLVTLAGIALGSLVALLTLVPMTRGITGENPYVPPLVYGSFVAAVLLLGHAATTLPARAALRRKTAAL
ncbi:FtsX-like permease family protein [Streptomyces sp. NPDC090025]|uniref:FtsX-like permease family protein n=1 Tax=Streptomyces sp. NPDC090025 TaxID=3365922 RepID=UPI0038355C46